jgi:hypothetical protein
MRVLPGTLKNPNYEQETGSSTTLNALTIASMSSNFHHRQSVSSGYGISKSIACILFLLAILWAGKAAKAQGMPAAGQPTTADLPSTEPHTTLVIFAGNRTNDRQWAALLSALRKNLAEAVADSQAIASNPEIVRGEAMQPGLRVDTAVVVFLHGDCDLEPLAWRTAYGVRLGWVRKVNGQIQPFAHVDCTQIGQVLGPQVLGLDRDRREALMAGAISRVILHEWIHIATRSSAHADRGIAKAQFGVGDLLAGDGQHLARNHKPW